MRRRKLASANNPPMKRWFIVAALILLMALAKWPLETSILKDRKEARYGGARLTLELRQQMPQMMAVALLGGFRGVVADLLWIRAHEAWERQEWYHIKQYFNLVTTLQPLSVLFWETAAWHMAWNISYAVSQDPREPRAAKRELARRQWIEEGRRFLEQGVENIPDRYHLYFHLGWLIMQKQDYLAADPLSGYPGRHFIEAADWFKTAWQKFSADAPSYVSRLAGHCYMKAAEAAARAADAARERAYWQQARDWWSVLWAEDRDKHPNQMWDKIAEWGRQCEERLQIPPAERRFPPAGS